MKRILSKFNIPDYDKIEENEILSLSKLSPKILSKPDLSESDVIVVIPTHKSWEQLNSNEKQSFFHNCEVLKSRKICMVVPKDLDIYTYRVLVPNLKIISVDPKLMKSVGGYNALTTSSEFWKIFPSKYVLLVQLDVWIFKDECNKFIDYGYDLYGAPFWMGPCAGSVGNSGFMLAKTSKMVEITEQDEKDCKEDPGYENWVRKKPDDVVFGMVPRPNFNISPTIFALEFSIEQSPKVSYGLAQKQLPMGCHAYYTIEENREFWKQFIPIIEDVEPKNDKADS